MSYNIIKKPPSSNSFETIQTPSGTSPVADSSTDTLTLESSDGTIGISGNSTTDTIDLTLGTINQLTIDGNALTGTDFPLNIITPDSGAGNFQEAILITDSTGLSGQSTFNTDISFDTANDAPHYIGFRNNNGEAWFGANSDMSIDLGTTGQKDVGVWTNNTLRISVDGSTGLVKIVTLTGDTVPIVNADSELESSAVTPTELDLLSGLGSAIVTTEDYAQVGNKDFEHNSTNFYSAANGVARVLLSGSDTFTTQLEMVSTANRTVTFPDATTTLVGRSDFKAGMVISDQNITAAAGVAVTSMSFAIAENESWKFEFNIFVANNNTNGVAFGIDIPASATMRWIALGNGSGSTNFLTTGTITDEGLGGNFWRINSATPGQVTLVGSVTNSTNAGTVQLIAAPVVDTETTTIKEFTSFTAIRIP